MRMKNAVHGAEVLGEDNTLQKAEVMVFHLFMLPLPSVVLVLPKAQRNEPYLPKFAQMAECKVQRCNVSTMQPSWRNGAFSNVRMHRQYPSAVGRRTTGHLSHVLNAPHQDGMVKMYSGVRIPEYTMNCSPSLYLPGAEVMDTGHVRQ
uniref:Uncharacterized protein n=1 Tax=Eutreptiella gymnastica TaxID=73025 RepID=A0A7S4D1N6_9EUGL